MPRMTPEEVEQEQKITRIFSPYAGDQMQKYFQSQPAPTHVRFVHYTSADAALKIIRSKRIWMRNDQIAATLLEDSFEETEHQRQAFL